MIDLSPETDRPAAEPAPNALIRAGRWIDRRCHLIYLALALPLSLWLALWMPPFQNPDEPAHFLRVEQISRGTFVGSRLSPTMSGGLVDRSVLQAASLFTPLSGRPDVKTSASQIEQSRAVPWSGSLVPADFRNTVNYAPFLYLPQAGGVWMARRIGSGVVDSLYAARLATALTACLISFVALWLCGFGRTVMLAVLLCPMTVSLNSSSAHDALLIAASAFAIGMAARVLQAQRRASGLEFGLFLIAVSCAAMARPPHVVLFAFVPWLVARTEDSPRLRWSQWAAFALAISCCAGWFATIWTLTLPPSFAGPAGPWAGGQIAFLSVRPDAGVRVAIEGLLANRRTLGYTMVGVIGWLDTWMPMWYYDLSRAAAIVAVVGATRPAGGTRFRVSALAAATFVGLVLLIALAGYTMWNSVGSQALYGLQGRYFSAALPLVAWVIPGGRTSGGRIGYGRSLAWIAILAFALITCGLVPQVVLARYYGY